MVQLNILTVSGMPAFSLHANATATVEQLVKAAAQKASISKKDFKKGKLVDAKQVDGVRLSLGRKFLQAQDTVQSLGLQNGSSLLLHVRGQALVKGTSPLPSFSFSSEGYGFYVNISAASGKALFRIKITPRDTAEQAMVCALRRAKISLGLKPTAKGAAKFRFKGRPLPPKCNLVDEGVMMNDELVLHGLAGEEAPPSMAADGTEDADGNYVRSLVRPSSVGSFNALARSPRGMPSPPGSPPRQWLPVGASSGML